jgi:hypothetical protein
MTVGTTGYSTYITSVQTAQTDLNTAGLAGNAAAAPSFANNVQQYPSLQALRAALSLGQLTQAQFNSYALASQMQAQVQKTAALTTLRQLADPVAGAGDVNAFAPA